MERGQCADVERTDVFGILHIPCVKVTNSDQNLRIMVNITTSSRWAESIQSKGFLSRDQFSKHWQTLC